jgi:hypothetical protein
VGAALVNYWNAGMPGTMLVGHRYFNITFRLFLKQPAFFRLDRPNSLVGPSKSERETSRRAPGVAPGTEGIWTIYKSINNPPTSIKTLSVILFLIYREIILKIVFRFVLYLQFASKVLSVIYGLQRYIVITLQLFSPL